MKLFWKINLSIGVSTFLLYLSYLILVYQNIKAPEFIVFILSFAFLWGTFLEVIQIPICLIVIVFTIRRQKKIVWAYLFMMLVFFIVKIIMFVSILSEIIPRVGN